MAAADDIFTNIVEQLVLVLLKKLNLSFQSFICRTIVQGLLKVEYLVFLTCCEALHRKLRIGSRCYIVGIPQGPLEKPLNLSETKALTEIGRLVSILILRRACGFVDCTTRNVLSEHFNENWFFKFKYKSNINFCIFIAKHILRITKIL